MFLFQCFVSLAFQVPSFRKSLQRNRKSSRVIIPPIEVVYIAIGFSSNFGCPKYGNHFFHIIFSLFLKFFDIHQKMQHFNKMLHFQELYHVSTFMILTRYGHRSANASNSQTDGENLENQKKSSGGEMDNAACVVDKLLGYEPSIQSFFANHFEVIPVEITVTVEEIQFGARGGFSLKLYRYQF